MDLNKYFSGQNLRNTGREQKFGHARKHGIWVGNFCLDFCSLYRTGRAGSTTPTLVGPKILLFVVKALYFQSSGRTNNCQIWVFFQIVGPILYSLRRPCYITVDFKRVGSDLCHAGSTLVESDCINTKTSLSE